MMNFHFYPSYFVVSMSSMSYEYRVLHPVCIQSHKVQKEERSGKRFIGPPIKKCPGVNAQISLESLVMRGLELMQALICAINVEKFSNVKVQSATTGFR